MYPHLDLLFILLKVKRGSFNFEGAKLLSFKSDFGDISKCANVSFRSDQWSSQNNHHLSHAQMQQHWNQYPQQHHHQSPYNHYSHHNHNQYQHGQQLASGHVTGYNYTVSGYCDSSSPSSSSSSSSPSVSVSSSANDGDYLPHAAPHTTMPDAGQTSKKVISRISTSSPLIAD